MLQTFPFYRLHSTTRIIFFHFILTKSMIRLTLECTWKPISYILDLTASSILDYSLGLFFVLSSNDIKRKTLSNLSTSHKR